MKKQTFTAVSVLLLCNCLVAQLPIVTAVGGDGRNVNWPAIKLAEENDDGPGFFYFDCADAVGPLKASSTLASQGGKSYKVENLTDFDPMTAWVEGVPGYGIGEWFEIKTPVVINTMYNGYQSTPTSWLNNSRVKRFKVYIDGTPHCFLDLTDEMGEQRFDLNVIGETPEEGRLIRFEIVDVYKGAKWDDVAISHMHYTQCCFATTTQLLVSAVSFIEAGSVVRDSEILSYDMASDTVQAAKVEFIASQKHVTLLRIHANGKEIDVTPDHPLYIKDIGFTSMKQLRDASQGKTYDEIPGMYEVLLWNTETQSSYYAPIESIEVLHGDFQTVTVRQLSNGGMYIANGFVSKTY